MNGWVKHGWVGGAKSEPELEPEGMGCVNAEVQCEHVMHASECLCAHVYASARLHAHTSPNPKPNPKPNPNPNSNPKLCTPHLSKKVLARPAQLVHTATSSKGPFALTSTFSRRRSLLVRAWVWVWVGANLCEGVLNGRS